MTVDRRIIDLYNEYVHTALPRREFLAKLTRLAGGAEPARCRYDARANATSVLTTRDIRTTCEPFTRTRSPDRSQPCAVAAQSSAVANHRSGL